MAPLFEHSSKSTLLILGTNILRKIGKKVHSSEILPIKYYHL